MGAPEVYELTVVFIGPRYCAEAHREKTTERLDGFKSLSLNEILIALLAFNIAFRSMMCFNGVRRFQEITLTPT